ncbi:MAG: nicotinate-nucleotide--dimethylbenzimidazole phosphoribosyltransferase [Vicingus serpentipes]|nr:nicotinate-nucleotide--dimethylbenzimidazole phosphoribosyltransferase [Vicingus serpentipes]
MKKFNIIPAISSNIKEDIQDKINNKTKPIGSLGLLEQVALKIAIIQNTLSPTLNNPSIVVFAGDHGIAKDGEVNPFPQEVTWQMVCNFLNEGAAINVFSKQNKISLTVVDSGVNYDFDKHSNLIKAKIDYGTKNYLHQPAMSKEQCIQAISKGAKIVDDIYNNKSNIIGFGEMGIGNTSSASLLMSTVTGLPIEECVGSGTGLDNDGIIKKQEILKKVLEKHQIDTSPLNMLSTYGGFEIAMICGAILQAAELKMTILIDGFIVTSALLVASKINSNVLDYCIFSHNSNEQGHQKMLNYLNAIPLLNLGLRLGEGTGAALSYPLVQSAVNFLNEMASFKDATVSNKE